MAAALMVRVEKMMKGTAQQSKPRRDCGALWALGRDAREREHWWAMLEHQESYEQHFEHHRRVAGERLSPRPIYTDRERKNILLWGGQEVTDDSGQSAREQRIWAKGPDRHVTMFNGIRRSTARGALTLPRWSRNIA
jgi:hypothetical protein